uniref:Uncharacterized protein n=1 Tax=Callorhinchus milii TaxID=7868 RepID=A0A4W3GJJ1_CALMI
PPPSLPPPPPRPNRGRLAEKRTIPLPPTRLPKKELSSAFTNSEDSEESEKANGDRPPEVKQEEEIQAFTMKRSEVGGGFTHTASKGIMIRPKHSARYVCRHGSGFDGMRLTR